MMILNQRVKEVRQGLGLSQAKFAKAISLSNGYIAEIELGNRTVNERIMRLISFTFHVNEHWLKTGEGEMFEKDTNQVEAIALAGFQRLKPSYQGYLLKQIELLLALQEEETQR